MRVTLGMETSEVTEHLKQALITALKSQEQDVEVTEVTEDSTRPLRFRGHYTHRFHGEIATGVVWYDLTSSTTGPDDVPAVVRNKLRSEVYRLLTSAGTAARALVDLHE